MKAELIEKVLLGGDLSALTAHERLSYYKNVCQSLGLNPLTKPFDYIVLDKKLVLYARKDCTEQLRKVHGVSITSLKTDKVEDVFVVTAQAKDKAGRTDFATGAVPLGYVDDGGQAHPIKGFALANAIMKAETKAKRRVTLSLCGLGMLDESELDVVTPPASAAILKRNVTEATANAVGEVKEYALTETPAGPTYQRSNQYGPLVITADNYKQLESHVGRAQGNMLGRKIGELHSDVIKWMYENWREKLNPGASDQDMRLKAAIEFAYNEQASGGAALEPVTNLTDAAQAQPKDIGAKDAAIRDLRDRISDLVLTEEQAVHYLKLMGIFGWGWQKLDDATEAILLHLSTPQGWNDFKRRVEAELKPKTIEDKPKKGRKRA
jgi:hypothetical protein